MFIVNGDMYLVREIEDRLVQDHSEGAFWIFKYLGLHAMIMRAQYYSLEVRHEYTSEFQD